MSDLMRAKAVMYSEGVRAAHRLAGMKHDPYVAAYAAFLAGAEAQRDVDVQAVMDLALALKEIKGKPTKADLLKLARRIRGKTTRQGERAGK